MTAHARQDNSPPQNGSEADRSRRDTGAAVVQAIILGDSERRVWGMGAAERLQKSLWRIGVNRCRHLPEPTEDMGEPSTAGKTLILRGDHIYEERLLKALVGRECTLLTVPGPQGGPLAVAASITREDNRQWAGQMVANHAEVDIHAMPAGMEALDPAGVASTFDNQLRKRAVPYVFDLRRDDTGEIEKRMFGGAYKGVTDLVTKWVWPWPARHVTRWLAPTGVTPNMVTALSLVFVFLAMFGFATGNFLWAIAAAWFMTFLDTVDGKLARVTLTSSKWGNVFDHGIDLVHPPFWWAAWYYGCLQAGAGVADATLLVSLWVVVAGYVLGRLEEGLFIWRFGIELHSWRRLDSLFRQITARRNPNLLILTVGTLAGYPAESFVTVAVWTAVSLLFHAVRIVQALLLARRGGAVRSWLDEPAGGAAA